MRRMHQQEQNRQKNDSRKEICSNKNNQSEILLIRKNMKRILFMKKQFCISIFEMDMAMKERQKAISK